MPGTVIGAVRVSIHSGLNQPLFILILQWENWGIESLSNFSKKVEEFGFEVRHLVSKAQTLYRYPHWIILIVLLCSFTELVHSHPPPTPLAHLIVLCSFPKFFFPRHIYLCFSRAGLTFNAWQGSFPNKLHPLWPCADPMALMENTLYCYQTWLTYYLEFQHLYNSKVTCM